MEGVHSRCCQKGRRVVTQGSWSVSQTPCLFSEPFIHDLLISLPTMCVRLQCEPRPITCEIGVASRVTSSYKNPNRGSSVHKRPIQKV